MGVAGRAGAVITAAVPVAGPVVAIEPQHLFVADLDAIVGPPHQLPRTFSARIGHT